MESPNTKSGILSKYAFPDRLAETVEAFLLEPEAFDLKYDIAVIQARLGELFQGVDKGESGSLWRRLRESADGLRSAYEANDGARVTAYVMMITDLIDKGSSDQEKWQEIHDTMERKRRFVETDVKIKASSKNMISVDRVLLMLDLVYRACEETVKLYVDEITGDKILRAVGGVLRRILTKEPGKPLLPGGLLTGEKRAAKRQADRETERMASISSTDE